MGYSKNKAVFLDRDGVINRERGDYTYLLEDFVLNDITDALTELQRRGYLLIVISNQSGIAKGIYTHEQVNYLNLHLERVLKNKGVMLTDFYYCPHHPDYSRCLCRKPDSLLLEKAIARYAIDVARSYFIGDARRDEDAGKKAGVKTIRIEPNSPLSQVLPLIN
jgi:D-glycero-D-manno-heptose 1,7-bisphosphate phosphatase